MYKFAANALHYTTESTKQIFLFHSYFGVEHSLTNFEKLSIR